MTTYRVRVEVDVEADNDHQQAACAALRLLRIGACRTLKVAEYREGKVYVETAKTVLL